MELFAVDSSNMVIPIIGTNYSSLACTYEEVLYKESDDEEDREFADLDFICSDGKSIKVEPFRWESGLVLCRYKSSGFNKVESTSTTLEMVKVFCDGRGEIADEYDSADDPLFKEKLNEFNSWFREKYMSFAFDLIKAAFELEIASLIFLMMKDVDDLFIKMTSEKELEEYDNFFSVNLKEFTQFKFERMKDLLFGCPWAFNRSFKVNGDYIYSEVKKALKDPKAKTCWDPRLLKTSFHEYRELPEYEQRRQWLTAHFLLRRPVFAEFLILEESDVEDTQIGPKRQKKLDHVA